MCEDCETEIIPGLGCDCGNYEPGFDKVAYFSGQDPELDYVTDHAEGE